MFDQLLELTSSDTFSFEHLQQWVERASDGKQQFDDLLNKFASYAAERFLDKTLAFEDANNALNQIMAVCNFDVPTFFWDIYVGFEDYEVSEDPDNEARDRIKELVSKQPGP